MESWIKINAGLVKMYQNEVIQLNLKGNIQNKIKDCNFSLFFTDFS